MIERRRAVAAALTTLPGLGPARLRSLIDHHGPEGALAGLAGRAPLHEMVRRVLPAELRSTLRGAVADLDVDGVARRCAQHEVEVFVAGDPDYPPSLAADHERPAVLFARGDRTALDARRVAIVGTRNATRSGLATARDLGAALAAEGVSVVSGLALGIDGAAHDGVRSVEAAASGRAVAVVGCGLDLVYPRRHRELWDWVGDRGLLLSEWAPGVEPATWRFPQRNRVIAALAEVLVVVESRRRGGSLITARAALDRGVEVMAVPGSVHCRAADGTNGLLRDGAAPVTSVDDVFVMLGLDHRRQTGEPYDARPRPDAVQERVLLACRERPCNLDDLVVATGLAIHEAALAAARLEAAGWLVEAEGWFESADSRLRSLTGGVEGSRTEVA